MPHAVSTICLALKRRLCSIASICRSSITTPASSLNHTFPQPSTTTTTNSRVPDSPGMQTHLRSSSSYSLTGSEIYDVVHRGQGLTSDGRLVMWYIDTPVHINRSLRRCDGVRLVTYVGGRRAEAYAILLDRAYHDKHYDLFFARIDTIFVSISPDERDIQLSFADNHTPAYVSGFITILVQKAVYRLPHSPELSLPDRVVNNNILFSEEDKPIHATAFLVASDTLPLFAREYALPYLSRSWDCIIDPIAFPVDNNIVDEYALIDYAGRITPPTPATVSDAAVQGSPRSHMD